MLVGTLLLMGQPFVVYINSQLDWLDVPFCERGQ